MGDADDGTEEQVLLLTDQPDWADSRATPDHDRGWKQRVDSVAGWGKEVLHCSGPANHPPTISEGKR